VRPEGERHQIPVLVLLDEFARLGHAEIVAKAFAFVAGYGLRLLPVLQSPAQLRADYGPDLAEEIIANCGARWLAAARALAWRSRRGRWPKARGLWSPRPRR
jgi:type IV secretion system protein VirD4